MANYYAVTRTNYFRVNDPEAFKALVERMVCADDSVKLFESETETGETLYDFGCCDSIMGVRSTNQRADADEDEFDFEPNEEEMYWAIAELLADGDACIIFESGHEKLRYVTGCATIITKDEIRHVNLKHEALKVCKELLGEDFETICEY